MTGYPKVGRPRCWGLCLLHTQKFPQGKPSRSLVLHGLNRPKVLGQFDPRTKMPRSSTPSFQRLQRPSTLRQRPPPGTKTLEIFHTSAGQTSKPSAPPQAGLVQAKNIGTTLPLLLLSVVSNLHSQRGKEVPINKSCTKLPKVQVRGTDF